MTVSSPVSPRDMLLDYQRRYADDESRFKAWLAARQIGKDFTEGEEIARDSMVTPKNTWLIASPSERQSLESLDKVKQWTEAYQLAIEDYREERDTPGALIKSATITYGNDSRVIAVPGRPETVRGFSANVFMTEFAFFEDAAATWKAVLPSITNPLRGGLKKARIASSANGKSGRGAKFYEILDKNFFNVPPGTKPVWSCHATNIYDAVAGGLEVDIEELKAALDDPLAFAQEEMNEFLDGSNILLPYDLIQLAESFDANEVIDHEFFLKGFHNPIYCGIDFGRTSDPTVCWTLEQIGDILWTREVLVLENTSTPLQNEILKSRIRASSLTCVDYTGPGIGFGDYAVRDFGEHKPEGHTFGKVELCTFTKKFKRQIFPNLRRKFEAPTKLRIPSSVAVREDLHAMEQIISNGEYDYWAPRTRDGHSDRCTALALAIRAAGDLAPFAYQSLKLQRGALKKKRFGQRRLA
jgi:phage FluMu gp28-like protein